MKENSDKLNLSSNKTCCWFEGKVKNPSDCFGKIFEHKYTKLKLKMVPRDSI